MYLCLKSFMCKNTFVYDFFYWKVTQILMKSRIEQYQLRILLKTIRQVSVNIEGGRNL